MTTSTQHGMSAAGRIPEWTLGDRLRKARSLTGMNTRDFADKIGVSHGTVTNAEGDKRAVRQITLNAWSLATGVSLEWLVEGTGDPAPTPPPAAQVDTDALRELTEAKAKRRGYRGGGGHTHQYPAAAAAA